MKRERVARLCGVLLLSALAAGTLLPLYRGDAAWLRGLLPATYRMPSEPLRAFGTFHFVCLGACILAAVGAGIFAWRHSGKKRTDRIVFGCGILFFLLEWYKQMLSLALRGGGSYDFSILPFQFCSLPVYICLSAPILGERAKHTLYCFLALFGTVGGYLVMGYPNLPDSLTLCIHTMLWHSLMIALGVYLLIAQRCGRSFVRDYLPAAGVFLCCFLAATALNILLRPAAEAGGSVLNLYYMSPYEKANFLVVGDVQRLWGWGASVAVYVLLFLAAGALPIWCVGAVFFRRRKKAGKS